MEHLITRTGGENETQAGKLIPSFVIDTAGAPASATAPEDRSVAAAPEWIELLPAGVFYARDGRGPFRLDDPAAVIASTTAMQMAAGLPVDYDHATDFGAPDSVHYTVGAGELGHAANARTVWAVFLSDRISQRVRNFHASD